MKEGDIVLVNDESPRAQWPLARVTRALVSANGFVRSVELMML
jgi:hypothetical protein